MQIRLIKYAHIYITGDFTIFYLEHDDLTWMDHYWQFTYEMIALNDIFESYNSRFTLIRKHICDVKIFVF